VYISFFFVKILIAVKASLLVKKLRGMIKIQGLGLVESKEARSAWMSGIRCRNLVFGPYGVESTGMELRDHATFV